MRFGPYELLERLAVGGMAEVFLALRTGADGFKRKVVLKRILPQYASDTDFQTLFADEARLGGLLHHPNIVQMFDYDRIDGVAILAMEYVAGHDLGFVLRKGPPLPPAASIAIALAVLDGLAYAHALTEGGWPLKIVHRDISPGNVLLSWDGQVKIADFGVARAETAVHETKGGELKGKIPYLSPEQVLSRPADARSDLFSFGVVLYQMLTGSRPFDADSEVRVLERIAQGEFLPPRRVAPALSPSLEPVIVRALASRPEDRFQSASELSAALREAARAAGIEPSIDVLRRHLATHFSSDPEGPAGDDPTRPAAGRALLGVPDRTPSAPRGGRTSAPAEAGDAPTVVDRKSSAPGLATPPHSATPLPSPPPRRNGRVRAIVGAVLALASLGAGGAWLAERLSTDDPGTHGAADARSAGAGLAAPAGPAVVVMRMTEQQEAWFLRTLLRPWAAAHSRPLRIVRFGDISELPRALRDAGPADLVKVPLPVARALVEAGLVRSITRLAAESDLAGGVTAVTAGFDPHAIALCEYPTIVGRELFFLPRKVEVRFLVYDVPAVRAAVARFPELAGELERALHGLVGHGLPRGFALEADPDAWDWYDLLAVSYVMSRTPDALGRTMPRVARRTHRYWGTVGTVLDMLGALGQREPIVADTPAMRDLVVWEAVYRELGLYHPAVYAEDEVLSGRGLYEAMQRGEVHLTTTHATGVRLLAGDPAAGLRGYLPGHEEDLGLAPLPMGVSLELDESGVPVRRGGRGGFEDGWLWGIPASAPDPARSLALLRFVTSRAAAQREARTFFVEPVRTDVVLDGGPLAARVAAVVARQHALDEGREVPRPAEVSTLVRMRDDAHAVWRELVVARRPGESPVEPEQIGRRLAEILARPTGAPLR